MAELLYTENLLSEIKQYRAIMLPVSELIITKNNTIILITIN